MPVLTEYFADGYTHDGIPDPDSLWQWQTRELEYADQDELLAFANKLRAAGSGNPLDALMPSTPQQPKSCLIANALNFNSMVQPLGGKYDDRNFLDTPNGWVWVMAFDKSLPDETVKSIAAAVEVEPEIVYHSGFHARFMTTYSDYHSKTVRVIRLPHRIGNTARAFDMGVGWPAEFVVS